MEHLLKPLLLIFMCLTISYAADNNVLQNPDFENATVNVTSQFTLLNKTNSNKIIPGWSFDGTVYYVTSGNNVSFPANGGHSIQLAENGRINQTFRGGNDVLEYVLSFNLAAPNEDCANYNTAAVNVTVYVTTVFEGYKDGHFQRSMVFDYDRNFSSSLWGTNAFFLGQLGDVDYVNLEIKSVTTNNSTSNCWPLVDALTVKRNHLRRWYEGNQLANGDFEVGPPFLKNSFDGILLNQEQDRFNSPLQDWSILGTIKYIRVFNTPPSKQYRGPQGRAAIELLSGYSSGIQIDLFLQPKSTYALSFTMGDANDSCVGHFGLFLRVGQNLQNFTMRSYGNGSSFPYSTTFIAGESRTTFISFYSFNETRTSDGVLCGPALDHIFLHVLDDHVDVVGSYGGRVNHEVHNWAFVISLFIYSMGLI